MNPEKALELAKSIDPSGANAISFTVAYKDGGIWYISVTRHFSGTGETAYSTDNTQGLNIHYTDIYEGVST